MMYQAFLPDFTDPVMNSLNSNNAKVSGGLVGWGQKHD